MPHKASRHTAYPASEDARPPVTPPPATPPLHSPLPAGACAGAFAIYGGLKTVARTGVLTAVVKIGGVTLLTVLALKAMTPSGGVIDGFLKVMRDNMGDHGTWKQALQASAFQSIRRGRAVCRHRPAGMRLA